jgi:SAM-dependent methyltransferase
MGRCPNRPDNGSVPEPLADALTELRALLLDPARLRRAVAAGRSRRGVPSWRRVELRPVDLKAGRVLQVIEYDERQAFTRNVEYGEPAASAVDGLLAQPFGSWHVDVTDEVVQIRVTKNGLAQVHRAAASTAEVSAAGHDRVKRRFVDPGEPFLAALGITGSDGRVKPSRQGKYHQVEEFVRALASVVSDLETERSEAGARSAVPLEVVDLGCGNAYLTFAAYRFLSSAPSIQGRTVHVTGVDVKAQAVHHGESVARALGWSESVTFVQDTVADAALPELTDIVMALHACDTATDDALARAVRAGAPVVLASPCCHHDIQRQLSSAGHSPPAEYRALIRQPILRERFADVLTDALRASLLRLLGYRVEVVEFVGSMHTPRNTLIKAVRTGAPPTTDQVAEYRELTEAWGVVPRLEELLRNEIAALAPRGSRPAGPIDQRTRSTT